jgi:ABC-2 type transport system ATP-binding protein
MSSAVEVEHLHKSYGKTVAVDDVSFTVAEGEIFGILGPNGAGKTTTVECVEGLRVPDRGQISVLGLDPRRDRDALRQQVGVQLQEAALPERLRVGEALELYSSFYRAPARWTELAEALGLTSKLGSPFKKLSGGQRQRLSIALALVGNPRVAVLDELTTGLDPQARRDTWRLVQDVRARGVTILLVTHLMEEAERLCDRVAVIHGGRVRATGTPASLAASLGNGQRITFAPSAPFNDEILLRLPEVTGLTHEDGQVQVTGSGDLLSAVAAVLARHQIVARQLRVHQSSLDDAVLALMDHPGQPAS